MDAVHWHLLLNHFPIVATLVASLLLIAGLGMKSRGMIHSSLFIMVVCALLAIPVFYTGEEAEETVEHIEGISHDVIHEHEEMAEKSIWFMYSLGALALLSLLLSIKKHPLAKLLTFLTLLLSFAAFYFMARTSQTGSHIRHTEIVSGF